MFLLSAQKNMLKVLESETITSGSVNVYQVRFQFDSDWDGLEKVAVFRAGKESVSVELMDGEECTVPWEVTTHNDVGSELIIGVCGVKDGAVVLPTIWARAGKIQPGARLGPSAMPPTPSLTEQALLEIAGERKKAEDAAQKAEDAAKRAEDAAAGGGAGGTGNVSSEEIASIKVLDRAEYEALAEKSPDTLYLIRG